jgi:hypothetical protein
VRFLVTAPLFVFWTFLSSATAGFCPMDEGLVIAQSHRLLAGQTPHADFVTPRPALSALLHLGDHLLPLPLFRASRLVALLEIAAYTAVLASLVFARSPRRWTLAQVGMWCIALLLNVHGFPLMAWYTIDGILLVALGYALVRRGPSRREPFATMCGLLLLGAAPLTKQSFFAAPLIGAAVLATRGTMWSLGARLRAVGHALAVAAIPGAIYWCVVVARAGFTPMHQQLLGADPTWGGALFRSLLGEPARDGLLLLVASLLAITGCDLLARRGGRHAGAGSWVGLALRCGGSVALLSPALSAALSWEHPVWGIETWCRVLVVCAWRMIVVRTIDGAAVVLLLLGWMTSLSWGYANPNLVAGSIVLAGVWSLWRDACVESVSGSRALRLAATVAVFVALLLSMRSFAIARSRPYFDRPAAEAVVDLGRVSPALAGIHANPITAAFLDDLATCVHRYPASHVAVVPDGAWIYPALDLANPLPLDWLYPPEYRFDPEVILPSVRRLASRGDYLVLFQPLPAHLICRHEGALPPAGKQFRPSGYGDGLPSAILAEFEGRTVRCGSVKGRWQPGVVAGAAGRRGS